jgi:regulation of enolase protein 1 (concanavalin A-like superfamily)
MVALLLRATLLFTILNAASAMFTIEAKSGTDAWRKPPSTDVFNAPTAAEAGAVTTNKLNSFVSSSVSFRFTPAIQYDQAGLVLSLRPSNASSSSSNGGIPPKWIKTGIEFYQNRPRIGTVGTDTWSDWSIAPVETGPADGPFVPGETWTTVRVESHVDELGLSLWVYQVVGDEKLPLREINWPFGYGDGWTVEVAAYAAKPGEGEPLKAEFKDFAVEWKE